MPAMEDERLGRLLRTLRRRSGMTQESLAAAARVPVWDVRRIEGGAVGSVRHERTRRAFRALDATAKVTVWWNGARADRLLDERHAAIVERVVTLLRQRGWELRVEVSFADYGERGSIDVFAALPARGAIAVFEVKSEIGSLEETNRVLDVKARLSPKLALAHFGWRPRVVGRVLVVPRDMTIRRVIDAHANTMLTIYSARSREVRAWLRDPVSDLRGIWFVSERANATLARGR